jgi:hypothetical protein
MRHYAPYQMLIGKARQINIGHDVAEGPSATSFFFFSFLLFATKMTEPNAPATLPLEDREKQAKISIIGKAVPVQIEEVDDTPETDWESDSPLWMSKLPDDPESNDALMGLQVLKFEEEIPEYRAEDYKERGNSLFRQFVTIQFYQLKTAFSML